MKTHDSGGSSSAPYNMALAEVSQKREEIKRGWSDLGGGPLTKLPFISLCVDKLSLGSWVTVSPGLASSRIVGVVNSKVGAGRKQGNRSVERASVWTTAPKVEGGVYYQLDRVDGAAGVRLKVEFNPAKMLPAGWTCLRESLAGLGVPDISRMWVNRYDAAFDYQSRRQRLILDDRRRDLDMFRCRATGPQTERTGFTRGSVLKAQLYDKTAERAAALGKASISGDAPDADKRVTRFELQVLNPEPLDVVRSSDDRVCPDRLQLADLPRVKYPGGDVGLRMFQWHPLRVADRSYGLAAWMARTMGLRYALNECKQAGWYSTNVVKFLEVMIPEACPSPLMMWHRRWHHVATRTVGQVCGRSYW